MSNGTHISDEEVALMRAAGIPVPESIEQVKPLLEEAEADPKTLTLDEAFKELRSLVRKRISLRKRKDRID